MPTLNDKKKKKLAFPSSILMLFIIIVIITILTWIVPGGSFDRVLDEETGQTTVVPDSFQYTEKTPVGPFDMFVALPKGCIQVAQILFIMIFAYYWTYSVMQSGALSALFNKLLTGKTKNNKFFIPICMTVFSLAGSTYGAMDSVWGLIPVFTALSIAMGYDALVGVSITAVATFTGFAAATTNPYTIAVAQSISELPLYSGLGLRWVVWFVFTGVTILFVMRYASKIKKDPSKSLVYGLDYSDFKLDETVEEFTTKHKVILFGMLVTIGIIVWGTLAAGWYLDEMSATFIISAIITNIIAGKKPETMVDYLATALAGMAKAMLAVGFSRAILVIITEGNILDTGINFFTSFMQDMPQWLAGEMMLVVQNIINFFIPSGSGQAAAIMPIMTPIADLVGVNRQIAVLAYQFGDGFSNMLWPTASCVIMCSIAKIPLNKWYRYFLPLFGIFFVLQVIFIFIATMINYQ